jgi:hypothetical protein
MTYYETFGGVERKVRTPNGSAGVNDPPSQDEEQWNRKNVQGYDLLAGHGRPRGSCWSENSQTLRGARSNRGAFERGQREASGSDRLRVTATVLSEE